MNPRNKNAGLLKAGMILASGLVFLCGARAASYYEDRFNYPTGALATVGSIAGWQNTSPAVTVTSNSLNGSLLGLAASFANKVTTITSGTGGAFNQFANPGIISGSVYFSFLLKVNSSTGISAGGQPLVGLVREGSSSSLYTDVMLRLTEANVQAGIRKVSGAAEWFPTPLAIGNVHLIVGKYEFIGSGNNDVVSLWVNPTSLGGSQPAPYITFSTGGDGNDSRGIGRVYIYGGASADLDELRIGNSWADVTPAGESGPVSAPYVTQTLMVGGNLVLRGTNGTPNGAFDLLGSTNAALPTTQWPLLSSGNFDASGNFDHTNPVPSGVPWHFYCLRSQGGGSPQLQPPTILTQPQDRTVLEGQSTNFNVAATGTTPLRYHWFYNTNTPLASGSNFVLTLNNIQLSQAGKYSVVVSNVIGSVTSVLATLTVNPAPPTINSNPASQFAVVAQTVQFNVLASGSAPLRYQWFYNTGTLLTDATNATLTLENVQVSDSGDYHVIITNHAGSITSTFASLLVTTAPTDGTFYVSPTGNDSNAGTLEAPFYTIHHAVSLAQPGDVIYVRGGTYNYDATIQLNSSGSDGAPIKIWAYPGELPVLDYSIWQPASEAIRAAARAIFIGGNWWNIKGLEIMNAPDNGIKIEGNFNIIERCVFHHNGDSGLQIGFANNSIPDESKAATNSVINCDSYRNFDPGTSGENADGFCCKLYPGKGNRFFGCRAWENSDDGWDLFKTTFTVVIEECWAWGNGNPNLFPVSGGFAGDGSGFKLGGDDEPGPHYVRNSVAFEHPWGAGCGFEDNGNPASITIVNCTSWANLTNFELHDGAHVIKNCVAFDPKSSNQNADLDAGVISMNNTWDFIPATVTANYNDFRSTAAADALQPRKLDGSLPDSDFAKLVPGSDLIDKGVNVGLPFNGSAPDLGAFESQP
ncbi:MAG TPA: immunoglobulin domain-containing protein [Verrucomicrobiota bacterium]|nr:immunoglobulin domain-containing protein [Verrucomicrobiota bacterium]